MVSVQGNSANPWLAQCLAHNECFALVSYYQYCGRLLELMAEMLDQNYRRVSGYENSTSLGKEGEYDGSWSA